MVLLNILLFMLLSPLHCMLLQAWCLLLSLCKQLPLTSLLPLAMPPQLTHFLTFCLHILGVSLPSLLGTQLKLCWTITDFLVAIKSTARSPFIIHETPHRSTVLV